MEEEWNSRPLKLAHLVKKPKSKLPIVRKGEGYKWSFWDYAEGPFALTVGALAALPQDSFGFACSIYIQSSRQYVESARDYFIL